MSLGRRFGRLATDVVVRRPGLLPLFRGPLRRQFDRMAPNWDTIRSPDHLASFEVALAEIREPPARALDLGTGTGAAAVAIARRWPETRVVGVDVSAKMLAEARRKLPQELEGRVTFVEADAASLPFGEDSFELVALANAIPFFDELARIVAPGGAVVFSFSVGPATPIYVPPERLRAELGRRGFAHFAEIQSGPGTAMLARKAGPG
jgi:SAM-dependent methyltransferase